MNAHSTIAIAPEPHQPMSWDEAYGAYVEAERAEKALYAARSVSDTDIQPAAHGRLDALQRMMQFPAPSLDALATKLMIFAGDDGHELTAARIMQAHMSADAVRLAQQLSGRPHLAPVVDGQVARLAEMFGLEGESEDCDEYRQVIEIWKRAAASTPSTGSSTWYAKLSAFDAAHSAESEGHVLHDDDKITEEDLEKLTEASEVALEEVFRHPATTSEMINRKLDLFKTQLCGGVDRFDFVIPAIQSDIQRLGAVQPTVANSSAFSKALANYDAALVALDAAPLTILDDDPDGPIARGYSSARDALEEARPSSATDFVGKFRALWENEGFPAQEIIDKMVGDAERLLSPAAPTPVAVAFAEWTNGHRERDAQPDNGPQVDVDPIWSRIFAAEQAVLEAPVTCVADAAAKLRVALTHLELSWDAEQIVTGCVEADTLGEPEDAPAYGTNLVYEVVCALERLDG